MGRLRFLGLLSLLSLSLPPSPARAQTVDCTDIAQYSASTIYNAGDLVMYQSGLYQATTAIWNAPPNYCPSCGWFTYLGSCSGSFSDTTPPSIPGGITFSSITSSSITVSWSASTDNSGGSGVAGYDVYRSGSFVGSPTTTSFTDTGLSSSTTYSYAVRARDNSGNASAQSAAQSVTTSVSGGGGGGDCTGASQYNASTIYNPGDRVVYQSGLYQAATTIWNAPPNYCPSCGWFTYLGTCGSTSTDTTAPSVPGGITFSSITTSSITISWSASTDEAGGSGVAGYDVYRGSSLVGSPTATTFTDTGLSANTIYSYSVRARDLAGNASAQSASQKATTSASPSDTTPPSVPTGLAFSSITTSSITISWSASTDEAGGSGVAGYDVYRGSSLVGSPTATTFTDTGLSANTIYSYSVRARDLAGNASAQSASQKATTSASPSDTTPPSVPTGLAFSSITTSSITVSWKASTDNVGGSGVAGYDVYRGSSFVGSPTAASFTDQGLKASTSYSYSVRARDVAGNASAQSAPQKATTSASSSDTTPPSVPAGLAFSSITSNSITVSWKASTDNVGGSGVAGYDLYRGDSLAGSPTVTSFTDTGLTPSTTYSYSVRARDVAGNVSARSAPKKSTTSASAICNTLPSVPTGLASPSQTSASVNLAWNASNPGANCTVQYRVLQNNSQAAKLAASSVSISGLAAGTSYSFAVAAVNSYGSSAQSAPISVSTLVSTLSGGRGGSNLMAYFAQGGIYQRAYYVKNIDTSGSAANLNVINYASNNVINNRCSVGVTQTGVGDAYADYQKSFDAGTSVDGQADSSSQTLKGNFNQLKKLKAKYPNLKIVMSLGGWTWSDGFYSAARPENRAAFVASCIDAYIKGNLPADSGTGTGGTGAAAGIFDGIDIDWEYLGVCGNNPSCGASSADKANFTALLAEFRKQLDAVRPGLLLTAAVAGGEDKIVNYDIPAISQYLDAINLMTYDFFGAWAATGPTAFHSPLYAWWACRRLHPRATTTRTTPFSSGGRVVRRRARSAWASASTAAGGPASAIPTAV